MPQSQKSRPKPPRRVKAAKGAIAKGKSAAYAYALPDTATKDFVVRVPPAGVKVAFVTTSPAAEKKLKAWSPVQMKRTGQIVMRDRSAGAKAERKIESAAYAPSSRARALLQGVKIAEADLMEAGGAFDLEEVQTLLNGVTRQAIEKRVKEGSLLAVPGPSNRRRYPTVQFTREGVVPGLKDVQDALPTRNPWAALNFFVRPDDRLGGRKPIDVLRDGEVDLVVSAARGMGVQGG